MRRIITYLPFAIFVACNPSTVHDKNNSITTDTSREVVPVSPTPKLEVESGELVNTIVLSERNINAIQLPFPLKDMTKDLEALFQDCSITKEIGEQDGPNFPLYSIKCANRDLGFFAMHSTDTLTLNSIHIKDSIIQDQYGLSVGDDFLKIKANRGEGTISFDPYHFHMYYYYNDSKISYELTGDLRSFDVDDVAEVVIEEADISDWKIEYIIWR